MSHERRTAFGGILLWELHVLPVRPMRRVIADLAGVLLTLLARCRSRTPRDRGNAPTGCTAHIVRARDPAQRRKGCRGRSPAGEPCGSRIDLFRGW